MTSLRAGKSVQIRRYATEPPGEVQSRKTYAMIGAAALALGSSFYLLLSRPEKAVEVQNTGQKGSLASEIPPTR
ncbi:hypothetical protein CDD81_4707 [Ophiocordyceps australis]|uniref:Uncharacterized protein n=1 Tax=Ophiocordyceps australis TaxID=1399860 RepID=A0A2C5YA60_9HYPO|nr:hypothetical protein CDD81_4707 [Ophiocordyceps australis]